MKLKGCRGFFCNNGSIGCSFYSTRLLSFLDLAVGLLDYCFSYEILLYLLHCVSISRGQVFCQSIIPLRLCVPSGRLSGPTEKPFLAFLTSLALSTSAASDRGLFGAIVDHNIQCVKLVWLHGAPTSRTFSKKGWPELWPGSVLASQFRQPSSNTPYSCRRYCTLQTSCDLLHNAFHSDIPKSHSRGQSTIISSRSSPVPENRNIWTSVSSFD